MKIGIWAPASASIRSLLPNVRRTIHLCFGATTRSLSIEHETNVLPVRQIQTDGQSPGYPEPSSSTARSEVSGSLTILFIEQNYAYLLHFVLDNAHNET